MEQLYARHRRLLMSLAYQLTGSFSDAEDIVQDVFLKAYASKPQGLNEAPQAYLCKMVTNRCRDLGRSARKRRESYFGEWLPEPVPTSEDEVFEVIARDELLSYGTMVLLERLTPAERAVFVLREALGFEYADMAGILDKSEANCRKLYSRAKSKLGGPLPEPAAEPAPGEAAWVHDFLALLRQDKVDEVMSMLAKDVVLISDGGGKANAAVKPVVGRDFVSRFLLGVMRKSSAPGEEMRFELVRVNGGLGLLVLSRDGVDSVVTVQVENGRILRIYMVRNPDKLKLFNVLA